MELTTITEWARLSLPPSTTNVHYDDESGIDSIARLRFDLPAPDIEPFMAALGFTKPLYAGYVPFQPDAEAPAWWLNTPSADGVGGSVLVDGIGREVYVEPIDAATCTVYLQTFEV